MSLLTTGVGGSDFTPDQIPGLVFAIRPDQGVTTSGTDITAVAPAWSTSVGVTGAAGTTAPQRATAFGPMGQDLFRFNSASSEFFAFGSNVTTATACTVICMYAPTDVSVTRELLSNNASTSYMRTLGDAAPKVNVFSVQTVGGSNVNIPLTAGLQPYFNMLPLAVTYDSATAGGTVSVYVNNILSGTAGSVGAGGFLFNRIGVIGVAANPYDGYLGPCLIYNRVLSADELTQLFNYLLPWRGQYIYVANSGSDASTTPWNRTTPLQTMAAAAALPLIGFETLAPKGEIWRMTSQANCLVPGLSPSVRMSWDGGIWGAGKAQIRPSTAPNVSRVGVTTVYDCGAFGSSPTHYVHYIPGGVIAFGPNYTLGNMQRLVEDVSTPSTPAVGHWGYTGGHVYVNAGVTLHNGDIEVTVSGETGRVNAAAANWNFNNIIIAFSAGTCGNSAFDNQAWNGMEAYFGAQDGFDVNGAISGITYLGCIEGYMGAGPAGTGASAGDGYSGHGGAIITRTQCQAWWNDKGGMNDIGDCTVTNIQCVSISSLPFRVSNTAGGSLTLINCLGIVPANAFSDDCVRNDSATGQATIEGCTLVSLKGTGSGITQFNAGGSITAKDNIITGFATGLNWQGSGTIIANYNDYFANAANFSGTTAGPNDIFVDPLFLDAADFNYALAAGSPCLGAGVAIPGLTVDLAGFPRPNPPAIGAYQQGAPISTSFLWLLADGSGFYRLANDAGNYELTSAP